MILTFIVATIRSYSSKMKSAKAEAELLAFCVTTITTYLKPKSLLKIFVDTRMAFSMLVNWLILENRNGFVFLGLRMKTLC
jgi:hypothetical protein